VEQLEDEMLCVQHAFAVVETMLDSEKMLVVAVVLDCQSTAVVVVLAVVVDSFVVRALHVRHPFSLNPGEKFCIRPAKTC
jgi:hypothetical protein